MSTASTMPVAPSQPALSEPERLINVFFAPTKTFADLRRNASWWVPWLILSLISIGFSVVLDRQVGFEQISENQIRMSPKAQEKMEQLTPEQQQQRLHGSALFFKWTFGYLSPITNLFFIVVIAAILLATFNFGIGTEITFKQSLAITAYVFLIRGLHAILTAVAAVANSDPTTFNISNPVGTNPAFFMSFTDTPRFIYSVLASFDIFALWIYAALGVGFAIVGRRKIATGIGVMAGWFVIATLAGAGIASAFS